jgi:hypothetical protein
MVTKGCVEKLEVVSALMSELRADLDQRTLSAERTFLLPLSRDAVSETQARRTDGCCNL